MNIPLLEKIKQSDLVKNLVTNHELAMDNSMYVNWSCPIKGLMSHVLKLRPLGKGSLALDYGTAIHAGLEMLMRGKDLEEATEHFIKTAAQLNIDKWLDEKRCTKRGIETLAAWNMYKYNLVHDYEAIEMDINGVKGKAVELGVKKFMGTSGDGITKLYWTGRVDAIIRYKDKLWVLDHKTSSMLGDKFLDDKLRSNQFMGYYTALNNTIRNQFGEDLAGVVLNVVCTGTKEVKFETYEIPFVQAQLKEWKKETLWKLNWINMFLRSLTMGNNWTMIERELCVTKYGKCLFYDVCNTVERARDSVLLNSYAEQDWNPHSGAEVIVDNEE